MRMVSHLRPVTAAAPSAPAAVLADPPPFGSPVDLVGTLCRQVDDLAAMIGNCRSLDVMTSRILSNQLGEMNVMLAELALQVGELTERLLSLPGGEQ